MNFMSKLSGFARDRSGNVALIFALSAGALLAGSAAAIDYSRYSNARSAILTAADAAAIAGAKTYGTPAARETAARQVFESNLRAANLTGTPAVSYQNIATGGANTGYRVQANVEIRALMGTFVGTGSQRVATAAEAKSNLEEPTEIVFVLDTTDSMEGDRIAALKSSTTGIIDEITRRVPRADLIKIGVVPFAQYVNVGTSNRSQSWLDVRADYQEPDYDYCRDERTVTGETNCRMESIPATPATPVGTCMRDGRARPCGGSPGSPARVERVCDATYSEPRRVCTRESGRWIRWNGCVGSRAYPLNTKDERYDVRIPGIMDVNCATPIQDLTTNISGVRSMINSLSTSGETYLPAGLIWGWRMLSAGQPLNAAPAGSARKYMILVTDGRNTLSPTYPNHDGSDSVVADRLTRETCANIATDRSNAIKVFTIAFEMDGLEAKAILQDCAARTGGAFFDATNAALLRDSLGRAMDSIFSVKLTR